MDMKLETCSCKRRLSLDGSIFQHQPCLMYNDFQFASLFVVASCKANVTGHTSAINNKRAGEYKSSHSFGKSSDQCWHFLTTRLCFFFFFSDWEGGGGGGRGGVYYKNNI